MTTTSNFTEEQIADFKSAFALFDEDSNGRITADEIERVMKDLGMTTSKEQVQEMIREVDADDNGTIDFQEFTVMLTQNMRSDASLGIMKDAFMQFDSDGDGFITADELKKILESLGEAASDESINKMIQEVDKDGDGRVSFEEFIKVIK